MNKTKLSLLFITFILLFTTLSYATEDVVATSEDGVAVETTTEQEETSTETDEISTETEVAEYPESVYFFDPASDYTLNEIIDGNVVIVAKNVSIESVCGASLFINAETVTFTGTTPFVQGNVYINAKNVNIGENTMIYANLFVNAENANIEGIIYDAYVNAQNITLSAQVYRDAYIRVKNTFTFTGYVGRNLNIDGGKEYNFTDEDSDEDYATTGKVTKNLNYTNTQEMNIPDSVVTSTENIHFTKEDIALKAIYVAVSLAIIFLVVYAILSGFNKKAINIQLTKNNLIDIMRDGLIILCLGFVAVVLCIVISLPIVAVVVTLICILIALAGTCMMSYVLVNNVSFLHEQHTAIRVLISFALFVLIACLLTVEYINMLILLVAFIFSTGIMYVSENKVKELNEKNKTNTNTKNTTTKKNNGKNEK